ncbi:transglutaminase family protein [Desulfosoma caldarium]|uniref:Transglutaminase-like putative cysteine protease n=1 Tax=Desulfosoma caldarium TaxID=610254 RepID=A0A3N1UVA7_9BACT|nr:transglutaminaseTgpA domain-containing protein [Desulfosoma caldarium]ROQ93359.1 transglutaminase-like putative cysteine protease [Desulfosoma caldarium]
MVKTRTVLLSVTYVSAALSYGAVFEFVHPLADAAFAALAALSAVRHFLRPFSVSRHLLNGLALAVMGLSLSRIRADLLVEPLVDGVLVLLGIKLLEAQFQRDYLQVYLLCLFLLLGLGLMSMSISFLFFLVPLALLLTLSLLLLTLEAADPLGQLPVKAVAQLSAVAMAIGTLTVPVALILFFILPRTNFPLLNLLWAFGKAGMGRSGFSDTVSLGDVTSIQEDAAVVFRAQMAPVAFKDLYWRGMVFDEFDGTRWRPSSGRETVVFPNGAEKKAGDVRQTIFMEPFGMDVLFGLDRPVAVERLPTRTRGHGTFRVFSPLFKKTRYVVWSRPVTPFVEEDPPGPELLDLPPSISLRVVDLAQSWAHEPSPAKRVEAITAFLQSSDFHYALENLPKDLETFLLKDRRGNCEYFASALAVLARLAGVPARLVGGYRGGYYNETGGYYLVLQKHAHVWTEVYLDGQGWLRVDPTPAAALTPAQLYIRSLLARWRVFMDTLNYYWFRIVVDYDVEKQFSVLRRARALATSFSEKPHIFSAGRLRSAGVVILGLFALVCFALAAWHRPKHQPAQRLRRAYARRLLRHGYVLKECQGVAEAAKAIDDPDLRDRAMRFAQRFERAVYRDQNLDKNTLRALQEHLRKL